MHCHECRLEIMMAKTFEQLVPAPTGRFDGISRPYTPAEVEKLRGSVPIAYTLAERGANRLWQSLKTEPYVNSLGAVTGNQAMQQARAGLPAIYLSGWQVAADANTAGAMYPDQSLYPANAGPELCRRINRTFQRADQIEHSEGGTKIDWFVPVVADAEAGFGGPLNAFEIMKAYIEAGAAGGRRLRRAELRAGAHRRRKRQADHRRCRRARSRIHHRRAHPGRLLSPQARHRPCPLHQARYFIREICRPDLVGDLDAEPRRGPAIRRGDAQGLSEQDAGL